MCKQIVLDTVTISNFFKVGKLDLLCDVYQDNVYVTEAVIIELNKAGIYIDDWICKDKIKKALFEYNIIPEKVSESLGDGEISCILYGIKNGCWIATDDKKARAIIKDEYKYDKITGTIGILIVLAEHGLITKQDAEDILEEMRQKASFWYKGNIPF